MFQSVKYYIEKNRLIRNDAKIIVGLSGGADSVVLLHILNRLGYKCLAAHCNFHLRGAEAEHDEQFSAEFAAALTIPFIKTDFDTFAEAKKRGISIEMAARELRYDWFEEIRKRENADTIAVAHHSDDSVETILLNLIRGTGIHGLTGIRPRNEKIIRPLLCASKAEILQYAKRENLSFITDSTNLDVEFTRNKIRNKIIPLLETINPSVKEALLKTSNNLSEAEKIVDLELGKAKRQVFDKDKSLINIALMKLFPSSELLLFEILKNYGFNGEIVRDINDSLDSCSGKIFLSSTHRLVRDRDALILEELNNLSTKNEYFISAEDKFLSEPLALSINKIENNELLVMDKSKEAAYFDLEKLHFPLVLRKWHFGDRFVPFGMTGSQKLSDYFNNNKINIPEKEKIWILISGNEIIWLVGYRTDNRFRVTKSTKNILFLKIMSK
ncbi:MAG: tRNA lysidine(34) synthetase TilS [Dysgonamonadaceae bacterium]|nr:tRNA lysidine(34) synthetase TilS [Dysgonamonadaceae bacterium]